MAEFQRLWTWVVCSIVRVCRRFRNSAIRQFRNLLRFHVSVEDTRLLQVMRHRVLRQQRGVQLNGSSAPLARGMRCVRRMLAFGSAKLLTEVRTLYLIKVNDLSPGLVAYSATDI